MKWNLKSAVTLIRVWPAGIDSSQWEVSPLVAAWSQRVEGLLDNWP